MPSSNPDHEERLRRRIAELEEELAALEELDDRQKLRRLLDLQDKERRWASFEIHDGVVQEIASALMFVEAAQYALDDREPAAGENLQTAQRLLRDALAEARAVINGLRPPVLDELGLVPALGNLAAEVSMMTEMNVSLDAAPHIPPLASAVESTIYRIVQECLTNAWRHGSASEVSVRLSIDDSQLRLSVSDDGVGFDPADVAQRRHGLTGILERAELLDGSAEIESAKGQGATIRASIPLDHQS